MYQSSPFNKAVKMAKIISPTDSTKRISLKNNFSPRFDSVRNLLERARAKLTRGGEGFFGFIIVIDRSYLQV